MEPITGAAPHPLRIRPQVIQQTAGFVRGGGGQLEVLLRVKQAGNPLFGFLLPSDPLHPFYRWLVETRPQDLRVVDAAPQREPDSHQQQAVPGPAAAAAQPDAVPSEALEGAGGAAGQQQPPGSTAAQYGPDLPPPGVGAASFAGR